jgi:hypothetical protein
MKASSCPCCESRDLKKLKGEQYICLNCQAPLRFTWSAAHGIGIFFPLMLSNLLTSYTSIIRFGIPLILTLVLLILYFRFRRFHLDDIGMVEARNAAHEDIHLADKFLAEKIGIIDYVNQSNTLKKAFSQSPAFQKLNTDHFNRVGGMSLAEQACGFTEAYPDVDIKEIVLQQQKEGQARLGQLTNHKIAS